MPKSVYVFGYYGQAHNNFGDRIFEYVFRQVLNEYGQPYVIKDLDDARAVDYKHDVAAVLVGGGDVFAPYFRGNIEHIRSEFSGPLYFVGVGVSWLSTIADGFLDAGDYFYLRNCSDYKPVVQRFGSEYVAQVPDLAFGLL